jgi:hypothetical protein
MFEEEPSRRAKLIGGIGLIALALGMMAVLYLLATHWGGWAH